jgi:hypothetical protein
MKPFGLIEHLPKDVEQETKEFFARLANISIYARAMEEKGKKRGIELGEHRKTIAVAQKLLELGVDAVVISGSTCLSIDEINKLKSNSSLSY